MRWLLVFVSRSLLLMVTGWLWVRCHRVNRSPKRLDETRTPALQVEQHDQDKQIHQKLHSSGLLLFLVRIPVDEMTVFTGFVKMIAGFEQGVGILLIDSRYGLHGHIVEFCNV